MHPSAGPRRVAPGSPQRPASWEPKAILALLIAATSWPLAMVLGDLILPPPCELKNATGDLPIGWLIGPGVVPFAAIVLGAVAASRIKRSQGRLKGRAVARLGVLVGVIGLLMMGASPGLRTEQARSVRRSTLEGLHRAELQYQARFPGVGYSPDLQSLGPPADGQPATPTRAGLVSAELAAGRYCGGRESIGYLPRAAPGGKIVGYTIHAEWPKGVYRLIEHTGELRVLPAKDFNQGPSSLSGKDPG